MRERSGVVVGVRGELFRSCRSFCRRVYRLTLCLLLMGLVAASADAQASRKDRSSSRRRGAARVGAEKAAKPVSPDAASLINATGGALEKNGSIGNGRAREQIWSGDAQVVMSGNDNPIVRVYLALGGSCTVEFPARDPYFVIHPPQPKPAYVVVDDSPTKKTDRYFIFRPGEDFAVPATGEESKPIATINVQMRSGLFVTFLIYPTRNLSLNAHRVLMKYDPNEVIAARRQAGLAVYLGDEAQPKSDNAATPIRNDGASDAAAPVTDRLQGLRQYAVEARNELNRFSGFMVGRDAREVAGIGSFGKEVNGLRVAAADTRQLEANTRVALVAVQNRRDRGVRLAQSTPLLMVETGRSGRAGEQRAVKVLYYETSAVAGVVEGKSTVFYAIVYEVPSALGAQQSLRVSVSEDRAVDRPASVQLARN